MTQNFARFPGYILFAIVDDPAQKPGWDILDIIVADQVEIHYESVGVAQGARHRDGSGYSNGWASSPQTMDGSRNFVVRKAQFLMGQKETNLVTELNAKVSEAEKRVKTAEETGKQIQAHNTEAGVRIKGLENDRDRALKERQTLVDVKNKLEADMAKLKKMLGEKTINDVLNPPTNG